MTIPPLKVDPGDPLTAILWNRMVDRLTDLETGEGADQGLMSRVEVTIRNDSGGDRGIGEILEIKSYLGPPTEEVYNIPPNIMLPAETPTALSKRERLCVLSQAIPDGEVGIAVISGLSIVKVGDYGTSADNRLTLNPGDFHSSKTVRAGGFASVVEWLNPAAGNPDYALAIIPVYSTPWLRFVARAKIANRVVTAEIEYVNGNVINPTTGDPYQQFHDGAGVGDIIPIYDAANLFPEIEDLSIGTAWFNREHQRWEIVTASRPVDIMKVKVETCLLASETTKQGVFGTAKGVADWIMSGTPALDFPPEAVTVGAGDFTIQFSNPCKLDAIANSLVVLRRHQTKPDSDPFQQVAPLAQSATGPFWEVERVCKPIARWGKFTYNEGSAWTPLRFWDGEDPDAAGCNYTTVCELDCACLEDGQEIVASYDPVTQTYRGIATASAMLGTPETITPLIKTPSVSGCGEFTFPDQGIKAWKCEIPPSQTVLTLGTARINSITDLYVDGSSVCAAWDTFEVIACGQVDSGNDCVDICPILCLCEEIYSLPDVCDPPPPPPCPCCECNWVQGVVSLQIDFGSDPQGSTDVIKTDDCRWEVIFNDMDPASGYDTRKWIVEYLCDGHWTAVGEWPGATNNGTPLSFSGTDGNCNGIAGMDEATDPGATASIDTDANSEPCIPPPGVCCDIYSGDEAVTDLTLSNMGDFVGRLMVGRYPITAGVPSGPGSCGLFASGPVNLEDQLTGGQCSVMATFELFYDFNINGDPEAEGCRWHYNIPPCTMNDPGGTQFPGDGGATFGCLGAACEGALGTCGVDGFQAVTLTIDDPDLSVTGDCNDPNPV